MGNFYIIPLAALIPLMVGFIWYNPKVLGTAWMNASGMTEEKARGANMAVVFGLSLLFAFLLAMSMQFLVIHQVHVKSMFFKQPIEDPNTEMGALYKAVMDKLGTGYRTFKHGAFHGTICALFIILPVLGTNALFERRGFKYIAINVGYWMICFMLMGGVISAFL